MKTKLMIAIFFVALQLNGNLHAQTNNYLLNNPIWQINSQCAIPLPCIENQTYNYYTNGDTTINALTYKKIYRSGTGYIWTAQPPPNPCSNNTFTYIDTLPSFFLRSAAKEMYVRMPSDLNEYLLYDFNLSIGDTLPQTLNNFTTDTYVVNIDSISTPFGYLKKFELSGSSWSQYLIEGIGHSKGLIEPMHVPLECGYDLLCFSLNDTAYYPINGPTCDLAVGVNKEISAFKSIIFPNPTNGYTKIQFEESLSNAEIIISNIYGQTLQKIEQVNGTETTLNFESFASGIYYLTLKKNQQNIACHKLIISR
jgi:hypothetical protein